MKVYRVPNYTNDKEIFRVPSSSEVGVYHEVRKLHTTAGTYVYKCGCIGYVTRAKANPFFECKHIKAVKDYEEKEFNETYA